MIPQLGHWKGSDLLLAIRVQPGSKKDELIGVQANVLKIRIAAPPIEGKANERLRRFLANLFGVSPTQVILTHGMSGRNKRVQICHPTKIPDVLNLLSV